MGLIGAIQRRDPPKVKLINLETYEEMEVIMNPNEISEQVNVNWNRHSVPGLSYQPMSYQGTTNTVIPLEFTVSRFRAAERSGELLPDILEFKRFIQSLTVPGDSWGGGWDEPFGAEGGQYGGRPPRVLFVWPAELITMECVVAGGVEFVYTRFALDARPLHYVARVPLEEYRHNPVTSNELRWLGSVR